MTRPLGTPRAWRARDLGVVVGALRTGPHNAITDVEGVLVGHSTIDDGAGVHTGVTAVVPDRLGGYEGGQVGGRAGTRDPGGLPTVPAAVYAGNGHGKLVGSTQVDEFGALESPIVLTATLSAFRAADAVLTYLMERHPSRFSFNPVVGETNDGYLSDVRRRPVTERHVLDALEGASSGPPAEGCVGAGTGTAALGFKGGIGSSSRVVEAGGGSCTLGTLVQSNFGGLLTVLGVPMPAAELLPADPLTHEQAEPAEQPGPAEPEGNSCVIVVATDAPLDARRLARLARRAIFAMGRVGASYANGSGDYAVAFTMARPERPLLPDRALDPLFAAVQDATEEALLNSLFTARTTTGIHGRVAHALPPDAVARRLAERGVL